MKRLIETRLLAWKTSKTRKPLIVYGARQIGKTYTILKFGKSNYHNVVYCNFEDNENLAAVFASDLDPERICKALGVLCGSEIVKGQTLIIFDEIQACERSLSSLKYFYENAPDHHIIAAGSLLGLAVDRGKYSFPVGKIDLLNMYPMTFEEFLTATGNGALVDMIRSSYKAMAPFSLHEKALELYRTYLVVGGYPAAVKTYIEQNDFDLVRAEQSAIANAYISDMAKYATPSEVVKSIEIYKSIISQLAKENTKFQYSVVGAKARAKDYELSLAWLKTAGVILDCLKVKEGKYPINIYEDLSAFKVYYSDIGLLTMRMALTPQSVIQNLNVSDKARGMLAESYVAEQLAAKDLTLHYWESDGKAELDFILQLDNYVIPVEVKSAENVRSKSLMSYIGRYSPIYSIRISSKNFGFENNIRSIPLYAVFCI